MSKVDTVTNHKHQYYNRCSAGVMVRVAAMRGWIAECNRQPAVETCKQMQQCMPPWSSHRYIAYCSMLKAKRVPQRICRLRMEGRHRLQSDACHSPPSPPSPPRGDKTARRTMLLSVGAFPFLSTLPGLQQTTTPLQGVLAKASHRLVRLATYYVLN